MFGIEQPRTYVRLQYARDTGSPLGCIKIVEHKHNRLPDAHAL